MDDGTTRRLGIDAWKHKAHALRRRYGSYLAGLGGLTVHGLIE